ncbi:MAG: TetR/AcrR family transcriptional regulator [Chloroflexota bacterium]
MVHNSFFSDWNQIQAYILKLEGEGVVTRTFRRLDPERQQAIVEAILDEAIERGPTSINIKQVAGRAGVAVGSLYQYFNNREGLLAFATRLSTGLMTDALQMIEPYLRDLPLREGLRYYLMGGMEWGDTMTGLVQFVARAAYTGDPALAQTIVQPIADVMLEIVKKLLAAAQQRGELRPDVDLDATARAVNALIIAVGDSQLLPYLNNYFRVTDESVPRERAIAAAVELVVRGITQ